MTILAMAAFSLQVRAAKGGSKGGGDTLVCVYFGDIQADDNIYNNPEYAMRSDDDDVDVNEDGVPDSPSTEYCHEGNKLVVVQATINDNGLFAFTSGTERSVYFDVTSAWARTELEGIDGTNSIIEGFTDTQVRLSFTAGRDLAVLSVSANLPTGESQVQPEQIPVVNTIAQNFLPFLVTSYGAGFGMTGGLALAQRAGAWNLGLAGSVRYLATYEPVVGLDYSPGLEGRVQAGVDRLFGERTRLTVGFGFSTYSTDDLTISPTTISPADSSFFKTGNRYVGEFSLAQQFGRTTAQVFGWGFYREAGEASGSGAVTSSAKEQIYHAGLLWILPVSRMTITPTADVRLWYSGGTKLGDMYGGNVAARIRATQNLTIGTVAGFHFGSLILSDLSTSDYTGLWGSVFLRFGV